MSLTNSRCPPIGHHPSVINNNFLNVIKRNYEEFACNAVQVWLGSPKSYLYKMLPKEIYEFVKEYVKENNIFLIAHSPYVLNFCHPFDEESKALKRYIADLINIRNLGGVGAILHMGSHTKCTREEGYKNFVQHLEYIVTQIPDDVFIILENMAGGGTRICCKMDEWSDWWNNYVSDELKKRLRWCIDTAHLYACGEYDLSQPTESKRFYNDFEREIGWDYVVCVHFNGSESALGSKRDKHADIGSGEMSIEGLKEFAILTQKPMILEVPITQIPLAQQINTIKSWF